MNIFSKKKAPQPLPLCVGRYYCQKISSWRGKYRRILCITPSEVLTQDPDQNFSVTNRYDFDDLDGILLGPGNDEEGGEVTISARQDKKVTCCKMHPAAHEGCQPVCLSVAPKISSDLTDCPIATPITLYPVHAWPPFLLFLCVITPYPYLGSSSPLPCRANSNPSSLCASSAPCC